MKSPSQDIAMSLRAQPLPSGRGAEKMSVTVGMRKLSMTVPGDGDVHCAPGKAHDRCVCGYADVMSRFGGSESPGFP